MLYNSSCTLMQVQIKNYSQEMTAIAILYVNNENTHLFLSTCKLSFLYDTYAFVGCIIRDIVMTY